MTRGLSSEAEYLISLLRSILRSEPAPLPDSMRDTDPGLLFSLAEAQGLSSMAYCALHRLDLPAEGLAQFEKAHRAYVTVGAMQEVEYYRISAAFCSSGIDHMPLKGLFTRTLYPEPLMRYMGDLDILIRSEDSLRIRDVMQGMGYRCDRLLTRDDDVYSKNGIVVELHRKLDADGLKNPSYYDEPWRFALPACDHLFAMKNEDGYLYTVAHAMKHFMYRGTGLKSVLDVYVYLTGLDMDRAYIREQSELMGITKFLECMERLAYETFGDEPMSDNSSEILRFMLASGSGGSSRNMEAMYQNDSGGGRRGNRFTHAFRMVFPQRKHMEKRSPVLKKAPYLLPVMHIWRWLQLLFCYHDRIRGRIRGYRSIDSEYAANVARIHELAGVDK